MKQDLYNTWRGIHKPFKKGGYIFVLLAVFAIMLTLFTLIPVWTVPGNTLAIQLNIFALQDYIVLTLLSSFYSLFLTLQIYVIREKKKFRGASSAIGGGVGALFAGVAGTAFCTSCLAPLFAIFGIGFGGVVFILEYKLYFVVAITIFMLIAIYLTARKIGRNCSSC